MQLEDYDCAVVVGTDWMTSSMSTLYFQLLGAISPTGRSVPWDESRDGFVMGEGSVCLVIEPLEKAEARGADIRWVVDGIGIANDGAPPVPTRPHRLAEGSPWAPMLLTTCPKRAPRDRIL